MPRVCAAATFLTFFVVAPVLAADLSSPPPVTQAYSWAGLYAGLQLGGAWNDTTWRLFSQRGSGFLYGGQLGYNFQFDQLVLGAEGDLSGSTLKVDSQCTAVVGSNCETKLDYLGSLRGRAGVAVDRFMFYADGGVAFAGYRFAQTALLLQSWSNKVHVGWTAGAGVEYAITDNIIGGVEYNYYQFPSETLSGGINPVTINPREMENSVVGKLSYKF
jgi:outer membrane immunogenic protein